MESTHILEIIALVAVLTVGLGFFVFMIRMALQDRKRYKNPYDEQGRPNRPGGWGIQ